MSLFATTEMGVLPALGAVFAGLIGSSPERSAVQFRTRAVVASTKFVLCHVENQPPNLLQAPLVFHFNFRGTTTVLFLEAAEVPKFDFTESGDSFHGKYLGSQTARCHGTYFIDLKHVSLNCFEAQEGGAVAHSKIRACAEP